MTVRKIYNQQTYTVCERSNIVTINDEDIKSLREWEENPYKGKNDSDLLHYINQYINDKMFDNVEYEETPFVLDCIYEELCENVTRTNVWNSLQKSGESTIYLDDENDETIDSVDSTM